MEKSNIHYLRVLFCSNRENEGWIDMLDRDLDLQGQMELGSFVANVIKKKFPELSPTCKFSQWECNGDTYRHFTVRLSNLNLDYFEDLPDYLTDSNLSFKGKNVRFYSES